MRVLIDSKVRYMICLAMQPAAMKSDLLDPIISEFPTEKDAEDYDL